MTRSTDRIIGGVCSGLGEHLRIPVGLVRVLIVMFSIFGGAGAIFYVWLWATVPNAEAEEDAPLRRVLTKPAEGGGPWAGAPGGVPHAAPGDQRSSAAASWVTAPTSAVSEVRTPVPPAPATLPPSSFGEGDTPGASPEHGLRSASASMQTSAQGSALGNAQGAPAEPHSPLGHWTKGILGGARAEESPQDQQPPQEQHVPPAPATKRKRLPVTEILLGGCLLLVGIALLLAQVGVDVPLSVILPTMAVFGGIALAWWQFTAAGRQRSGVTPRVLGSLTLVAAGVLMFFLTGKEPDAWTIVAASLAVLAGVGVAVSPWLLRLNRELIAERAGRARVEERAEIAAHLHDSVLQTLALIQQKSETGSEVSRIARAQERDLREWLFRDPGTGNGDTPVDLELSLREHAAQLEVDFPVRFEIVSVGQSAPYPPEPLIAAAREAMLNAARHAGGAVTVYAEVSATTLSVDIADRGPGMRLDELPAGRMGVRESILGRMERAGGTARILPGPGGTGTSVRLSIARPGDARAGTPGHAPDPETQPAIPEQSFPAVSAPPQNSTAPLNYAAPQSHAAPQHYPAPHDPRMGETPEGAAP